MRVYDYYIIISESKDKCMHKLVERKKQHDTHTKHTRTHTLTQQKNAKRTEIHRYGIK